MKADVRIERQILDYLEENPEAQDTLEGIVEWWLLKRKIIEATTAVESALARLVSQGRLEARAGRDGRTHYRAKRPH